MAKPQPAYRLPSALAGQPLAGKPMAGQPITSQPITGQPMTGQPMAGQPMAGQPMAGQPMAGLTVFDRTNWIFQSLDPLWILLWILDTPALWLLLEIRP
jgi:hypothetical protein